MALVFVAGCSPFKSVSKLPFAPGRTVELTPELKALYLDAVAPAGKVQALDGFADLYLSTPNRKNKAYCTVQLQKSRDARLIITAGIIGWPVADLLIRPDSLFVHDMLNNRMLVGRNNAENLGKILGIDTGFGKLTETLFGIADTSELVSDVELVRVGEKQVSYMVRSGSGTKELVVDLISRELAGISWFDASGRKSVEFRFADYQRQAASGSELKVPWEIDMIVYGENDTEGSRSMKVVYDERVINPPEFTIRFKRPRRAKTVNLDELTRLPWM